MLNVPVFVSPKPFINDMPIPQPVGHQQDGAREGAFAQRTRWADDHQRDAPYPNSAETQSLELRRSVAEGGKNLWFIPGLSNMMQGAGNAGPGADAFISGALDGFRKTCEDGFDRALLGAATGDYSAVAKGYCDALRKNEATPGVVKRLLNKGDELANLTTAAFRLMK